MASKILKCLGILMKEMKDFYSENYKTLNKEIKEHTKRWKELPCYGLAELLL
jgi:hypothetical protein